MTVAAILALNNCASGGGGETPSYDPDKKVTLTFT